jgi:outer membrane protein assembly factor BamB
MAEGVTRRALLGSIGTATAAAVAPAASASDRSQTTSDWPTFAHDAANSGYAPETTGPTGDAGGRWRFETDGGVSTSAAVVDGTVYVGDDRGNLYALGAADGAEEWRFTAGGQIATSPAVVGDTVYVGSSDNYVYAVDRADGTERWRFETDDQVVSSPTVVDGTVYVGSQDYRVYALDAATGEREWAALTGNAVPGTPAVVDDTVYVGSEDRTLYALSAGEGELEWEFEVGGELPSAPTVVDGTVYVGSLDSTVYAVDAESGEQQWQFDTGGPVVGSPAVADGTVYTGSRDSTLYAIDATDGSEQWTYSTALRVIGSPAVAGDLVYVGDQIGNVYGVTASDGSERWVFETGESFTATPAVVDGVLYMGSELGVVYALEDGETLPTETPGGDPADQNGDGLSLEFLALPVVVASLAGFVVGVLYVASRIGVFEPLEDAAPDPPPFDAITQDTDEQSANGAGDDGGDAESQIREVVLDDVIRRAEETTRAATEDLLVTKYVDSDTLSAPMVAYEIESLRSEPATVRIAESVDPDEADADAIGDLPGGEGWRVEGDELVFQADLGPEQTTRTLVARRDLSPADSEQLLARPTVAVE